MSAGALFPKGSLLVDGQPVEAPQRIDTVFAVVDTSVKDGTTRSGVGAVYFGFTRFAEPGGSPRRLTVLDWDLREVDGRTISHWLPSVFARLDALAETCTARLGSTGAYIENEGARRPFLNHGCRMGLPVQPLPDKFTSFGDYTERALQISEFVSQGEVKVARAAYERTAEFKGDTRNHLMAQVLGLRVGAARTEAVELLRAFCAGVFVALVE